jgi:hypothetical protein
METRLNIADIKAKLKAMMTAPIEQAAEEARVLINDVVRYGIEPSVVEIEDYTCAECGHKAKHSVDTGKDRSVLLKTLFALPEWRDLCAKRGEDLTDAAVASRKVRQAAKA